MNDLPLQTIEDLIFGRAVCPDCNGTNRITCNEKSYIDGSINSVTHGCPRCSQLRHMRKTIGQVLPRKYQECKLGTLMPSEASRMPFIRQQETLDSLRANRDASVLLYGAPGTSKTTLSSALLRRAIERNWSRFYTPLMGGLTYRSEMFIWSVTFDNLMAQYLSKQADREAPEPDVTPQLIKASADKGRKFVLCLEEVDKAKLTEHRMNKLFDIVNALYNAEGQLILTTNLTPDEFEAMFTQTDSLAINTTGAAFLRRVQEMCEVYNFFE